MKEIWKDVVGLEDYAMVSNLGNVMSKERVINYGSYKRTLKSIRKKGTDNGLGYIQYQFTINNKSIKKYGHVMVAEAFLEKKDDASEVNHIDGDKSNNRLDNLEWVTHKENILHAIETGLIPEREITYYHKECLECNVKFIHTDKRVKFCSLECSSVSGRKVKNRPSKEELHELIVDNGFEGVGRIFNINSNSVRKWCQLYGMSKKASDYK